tara:strand:- start:50 stop:208 length:159 start_codon:yes stop_codon:yes gene_type:complete
VVGNACTEAEEREKSRTTAKTFIVGDEAEFRCEGERGVGRRDVWCESKSRGE